jgi:hypothetical protein
LIKYWLLGAVRSLFFHHSFSRAETPYPPSLVIMASKAALLLAAAASLVAAAPQQWQPNVQFAAAPALQVVTVQAPTVTVVTVGNNVGVPANLFANAGNTGIPGNPGTPGNTVNTGNAGNTGATGNAGNPANNVQTGNTGNTGNTGLTPNGRKAGSAGGRAVPFWKDHLGWWYDWSPVPGDRDGVQGVAMLWGDGHNGEVDQQRWQAFQQLSETPKYLLAFNEPDCSGAGTSADMAVEQAVQVWNDKIAPWGDKGSLLGSPSMCRQLSESWLAQFNSGALRRSWDFTAIHIYKPDMEGVRQDIEHYAQYGKPIWVTEFACVWDQNDFTACTDQGQINQWIRDVVDLFEGDGRVMAYGYTDGGGLNDQWLPTTNDGSSLTEAGQVYLDAISKYH